VDIESGEHESGTGGSTPPEEHGSQQSAGGAIDIARLTALVYRLMLDELRLDNARGARRNT
jgi:hypothetical protein